LRIIHKDCDKSLAKDRSLPRNSYLVTYIQGEIKKYDVVQASSFVEVFDNYYDNFGKDSIQKIQWTDGTVNPKTYQYNPKGKKK
jgi:hypothetical protein